jgi:cytochrome c oxidase cbb3-type subunit 1
MSAKAWDAVLAFHAGIGAVMAAAGLFLIFKFYFDRTETAPAEIDGKPNYNYGPIKFASVAVLETSVAC